MNTPQKAGMKKKKTRYFETYISKVLKQVSESNGITSNSKQQLNSSLCIICRVICDIVAKLTEISKKKTLSYKEVSNAIRIAFPGELGRKAYEVGSSSVDTFNGTDDKKDKGKSRQDRSGIIFPPSIVEKFLRNFGYSKMMVTNTAPIYLASVLQFLATTILNNSIVNTNSAKRIRVTIRDMELAVRNDVEFNTFFVNNNITFLGGGVTPYLHPNMLVKKYRRKKKSSSENEGPKNEGPKKHRFRPGTVAIREIKKYQKLSNCLTFAKSPFEKAVRASVARQKTNDSENNMKVSKDVFIFLQYFVEQNLVQLLRNANFASIHAGRVKLIPVDINFVSAISRGSRNPYNVENLSETAIEDVEGKDVEE